MNPWHPLKERIQGLQFSATKKVVFESMEGQSKEKEIEHTFI